MKKSIVGLVIFIFFDFSLSAQEAIPSWSMLQIGIIFKFEHQKQEAIDGIDKANQTITKAQSLISFAQSKNKKDVEAIAGKALQNAQKSKERYEKLKLQIEKNIAYVKNRTASKMGINEKITGIISAHSGRVDYISSKAPSATITIGESESVYVQEGDTISTYENSTVQIECLDGRGNIKLEENSRVKIEKKDAQNEILSLLNGKIDVAVDKAEKFNEMIEQNSKQLLQDLQEFPEREIKKLIAKKRKFSVRTPAAVLAVRGTKFTTTVTKSQQTIIEMHEGVVDITNLKDASHFEAEAGEKVTVNPDGTVMKNYIDLHKR